MKLKNIFNRMVIVGILILLQLGLLVMVIWNLSTYFVYFYGISVLLSAVVLLHLISTDQNPSYKLAWTIPILLFPVFGGFFYILAGNAKMNKKLTKGLSEIYNRTVPFLQQNPEIIEDIQKQDKNVANQAKYIKDFSLFPIYKNTSSEYLSPGEKFYEKLLEELKKAKHFIFLEYFIIQEGVMWDSILEILEEKAEQGVDVRLIYDDIGCLKTLPYKYDERIRKSGIKCMVFNRLAPVISFIMNNRDHRKITVIDGHTGFMGGINLADEYINEYERFGHWKDAAIMLKGEAVWNLTMMFLQMWELNHKVKEDYEMFKPYKYHPEPFESDGYVQPYGDSPLDHETVGENVYLNILHKATDYVYIETPYLIVDNEMVVALELAAKSGVDIRIITPHIPDKWYVHTLTRAYYLPLIEAGVKIYEYTPGFIHSKAYVSDDEIGVVGSINMDYRSLYLHFECATWLYKTKTVAQIKEDFLKTLELCTPITEDDCIRIGWGKKLIRAILRLFAPLM